MKTVKSITCFKKKSEKVSSWIKQHKKEISISSGVLVLTGIGIVIGLRFKGQTKLLSSARETTTVINDFVSKGTPKSSHIRREHIRTLLKGTASPQKRIEAAEKGFKLLYNETFVKETIVKA